MALSAKHIFLLFLLTLILSSQHIHARENQFFNKVPSNTNTNNNDLKEAQVAPNKEDPLNKPEQEPNFIPENDNGGYGLYDQQSGQFPPTTTTNDEPYKTAANLPRYLPKNYNTEAYVTEPEGYKPAQDNNNFYNGENNNNNNNFYNGENNNNNNNFYNGDTSFAQEGYTTTGGNNYNYYNGENSFNGQQQQGMSDTRFAQNGYTTTGGNSYNYINGGNTNVGQKQGMSDTRFLENGKYYYDVNREKNNFNAYENNRGFGSTNYGNINDNSYQYQNSVNGYQIQDNFQDLP